MRFSPKKPAGIAILALCAAFFGYFIYTALGDAISRHDFNGVFALVIVAIFAVAYTVPAIRAYVGQNPKTVARFGWAIVGVGLLVTGIGMYETVTKGRDRADVWTSASVYICITGFAIFYISRSVPAYLEKRNRGKSSDG